MQDRLEAVKAKITEKYPAIQARTYAIDIQNHAEIDETVKSVVSDLGEIEVLVNNVSPSDSPSQGRRKLTPKGRPCPRCTSSILGASN